MAIDHITNIIKVIQLGKKTGSLTVEHENGSKQEAGEIIFVHGQIVKAQSGQLNGYQALNWISTWGACSFSFIPLAKDSLTQPQIAVPPQPSTQPLNNTPPDLLPSRPDVSWYEEEQPTEKRRASLSAASVKPRRVQPDEEMLYILEQAGLSRLHRHLFQLADGQRNRAELARLLGRKQDEVQRLLDDLERIGVIHM